MRVCPRTRSRAPHARMMPSAAAEPSKLAGQRAREKATNIMGSVLAAAAGATRRAPTATATYPRPHRLRNPPRPITARAAPIAIPHPLFQPGSPTPNTFASTSTSPSPPTCPGSRHQQEPPSPALSCAGGHSLAVAGNLYILAPPALPCSLASFPS